MSRTRARAARADRDPAEDARRDLSRALHDGLESLAGRDLVARALGKAPRTPVILFAVGKASLEMTRGALDAWEKSILRGLVVAPDGVRASFRNARIEVLHASHPIPDARSVRAGKRALALVGEDVPARFTLLSLVSGGASSLVCAPKPGVTLAALRALNRELLASGLTIQRINKRRIHASCIKGGGLARAALAHPGAKVRTLIISDIIAGTAALVGSGLTVIERGKDARARSTILASPEDAARAVASALGSRGYRVRNARPIAFDVAKAARFWIARARSLSPGEAIVACAEPTLRVAGARPGKGGRSTHLAALVAPHLPADIAFMAAATDGVDGRSNTAGAVVTRAAFAANDDKEIARALKRFDSTSLHRRAGTALRGKPSGMNFADVHAIVRAHESPRK